MQMTLTLDACARCGQPILPGQPVKQTATVDIIGGRVVASKPRSWHLAAAAPATESPSTQLNRRLLTSAATRRPRPSLTGTGGAFAFSNRASPTKGEYP